jgi:NAD(P)-dependent dehydrogenase (short-subunit alcohol dehydrogenase family)
MMMETNAGSPFFLSTALGRQWLRRGEHGSIVNVASQAGIVAIEERAPYGASKAALIHVTKVLAVEWAQHNIRVNGVAPTFVRTEMTESTFARKEWADELLSRIPMGRLAEPDDVTGAVIFLISDAARFITGQTLLVDGGSHFN